MSFVTLFSHVYWPKGIMGVVLKWLFTNIALFMLLTETWL